MDENAGHRVIAPDLIGFGKSDKPTKPTDITYARHEEWVRAALFDVLDLTNITMFMQDWGGLIGMRLVGFYPERFARAIVANTVLPVGGKNSNFLPDDGPRVYKLVFGVKIYQFIARFFTPGMIGSAVTKLVHFKMTDAVKYAYTAPYPSNAYMAAPRAMPPEHSA